MQIRANPVHCTNLIERTWIKFVDITAQEMRAIYRQTVIIRRPTYGIISGYHEIPYVCLGEALEHGFRTTRVKGRIHVSPRFVLRPDHMEPSYGEIFGEGNVDAAITGRLFGYFGFRDRPVECKSEQIEVKHLGESIDRALSDTIDSIEHAEDITTGVMITPNARYFPVSIERLIATVLEDEFRV